jgi:hypothetical protein
MKAIFTLFFPSTLHDERARCDSIELNLAKKQGILDDWHAARRVRRGRVVWPRLKISRRNGAERSFSHCGDCA